MIAGWPLCVSVDWALLSIWGPIGTYEALYIFSLMITFFFLSHISSLVIRSSLRFCAYRRFIQTPIARFQAVATEVNYPISYEWRKSLNRKAINRYL
jgi:hypothetical protein